MVEEIGEPDLAGNASKDILDILGSDGLDTVSYTHLDVYKRQQSESAL